MNSDAYNYLAVGERGSEDSIMWAPASLGGLDSCKPTGEGGAGLGRKSERKNHEVIKLE